MPAAPFPAGILQAAVAYKLPPRFGMQLLPHMVEKCIPLIAPSTHTQANTYTHTHTCTCTVTTDHTSNKQTCMNGSAVEEAEGGIDSGSRLKGGCSLLRRAL